MEGSALRFWQSLHESLDCLVPRIQVHRDDLAPVTGGGYELHSAVGCGFFAAHYSDLHKMLDIAACGGHGKPRLLREHMDGQWLIGSFQEEQDSRLRDR